MRIPRPEAGERGFTLIELVVSMTIMSVVMAVMTAAVAQIYSAANRVDTTSFNRSQITTAFRRLDAEMRYATWIGPETTTPVGSSYYVEYAMGGNDCRELKFDTSAGVLSLYSWTLPSNTPANPVALASNVSVISGVPPFKTSALGTVPSADPIWIGKAYAPQYSQLRVRFNAVTGTSTVPFDAVYTAQNTQANTAASNNCSNGRPTS